MKLRGISWIAALVVAGGFLTYGALDEGPPLTNADRVNDLAEDFACPVCAGQSVAQSDVPVAREIRRQIAVWVDEGRTDAYIRDQLVAAYDVSIDYNPSGSGITSLVWVLPVVAAAGIAVVLVLKLRPSSDTQIAAATVITTTETAQPHSAPSSASVTSPRYRRNVLVWIVAIGIVAAAAGVLVARFSGSRSSGESVTGDIRASTRQLIFDAQATLSQGDLEGAIELYDQALELAPSNIEALTYRGWLTSRAVDESEDFDERQAVLADGLVYIDDAIAIDPTYADARLFRAIISLEQGDADRAAAELEAFDSLDPPVFAQELIERANLRERVAAAVALKEALIEDVNG